MNYYDEIRDGLIDTEVYKRGKNYSKNRRELDGYYKFGKMLAGTGKHYGEGIIKEYSIKLSNEFGKKHAVRTLFRMKQFYLLFNDKKVSAVPTQLTWSHYCELLSVENIDKINYYIKIAIEQNLTYRKLRKIKVK